MCLFAGLGGFVCASTKLQTTVLPFAFEIPLKLTAAPHLFPCLLYRSQRKTGPYGSNDLGSRLHHWLRLPRVPIYGNRVRSLYKAFKLA
jgi:hypothetical protein